MANMYGIELSEDEILLAEDMGLSDFIEEDDIKTKVKTTTNEDVEDVLGNGYEEYQDF